MPSGRLNAIYGFDGNRSHITGLVIPTGHGATVGSSAIGQPSRGTLVRHPRSSIKPRLATSADSCTWCRAEPLRSRLSLRNRKDVQLDRIRNFAAHESTSNVVRPVHGVSRRTTEELFIVGSHEKFNPFMHPTVISSRLFYLL